MTALDGPRKVHVVPSPGWLRAIQLVVAILLLLELPALHPCFGAVRINEVMAENDGGLRDLDDSSPDWIEIYNDSAVSVDLAGWHLTDSPTNLARWTFPTTILQGGAYLLVFASGKNRAVAGAELHTDFALDSAGGYLALVQPDGVTVVHFIQYSSQRANVSFGTTREVFPTPLVNPGAMARVFVPSNGISGLAWTAPGFADAGWPASNAPVGFSATLIGTTLLALDFNERGVSEPVNTEPGFESFVINSNVSATAIQIPPTTRHFNGISVTVSNTAPFGYDDRNRGTPANSGAFTETLLLRDFIFSQDSGTGGLDVTVAGLAPGGMYRFTVWSYDNGSSGNRVSDWFANGVTVTNNYSFGGQNLPTSNEQYRFTFETIADGAGQVLLSGRRDASNISFGVFLNALRIVSLSSSPTTTGLAGLMLSNNATAYLRFPFSVVSDPSLISSLKLRMRYDDGFVAYLNGQVIASRNAPALATWNSTATQAHSGAAFEEILIEASPGLLLPGANVLAIQGLNVAADDLDFTIAAELIGESFGETGERYFLPPTPGAVNNAGYLGLVADTKFSRNRGFYEAPFSLSITSATAGAEIRFTTNGSPPSPTNGFVFTSPITIGRHSFVRAAAFKEGSIPSDIDTHSYIFLRDVLRQSNSLAGYPTTWEGTYPADYEMDSNVVKHAFYGQTISNDLRSIPVLSIVTEFDGLWGPTRGIYNHATSTHDADIGQDWERAASAELILPEGTNGRTAFAVNCGIRMQGNASRFNARTPKHSIRLLFKSEYGPTKLRYPWFAGDVEEFDNIVLRAAGFVDGWPSRYSDTTVIPGGGGLIGLRYRPETSTYLRDVWVKASHRDMGWMASRSDWVHLYINGLYWGIYNPAERLDAAFVAGHLGGNELDWDVLVGDDAVFNAAVADGNKDDWTTMMAIVNAGITSDAAYQALAGLVDLDSLIDYMLLHIYVESEDWPHHNWYAAHRRANPTNASPATKWTFLTWDQELSLDRLVRRNQINVGTGGNQLDSPGRIYSQLRAYPEFRIRFGDRIQKHLFNGGALTPDANVARFAALANVITNALVGESARWGDAREFTIGANPGTGQTFTRDEWWVPELQKLYTNFFQTLTADNIARFRAGNLYPLLGPPQFSKFGGDISNGFALVLTHTNSTGILFYTIDGSDPRVYGTGAVAPNASAYTEPISFNAPTLVRSRVLIGTQWSALVEAVFYPPQDLSRLAVTEIMFNPAAAGFVDGDEFEFLELKNTGTNTLNLGGLHFSGINYFFPLDATLPAGGFRLLVRNPQEFANRYPGVVFHGVYSGRLANEGEAISLLLPAAGKLLSVDYRDTPPWPAAADGHGFSLVPRVSNPAASSDNGQDWRASANVGGSPGTDDPQPLIPAVLINELIANPTPPAPDAVELFNPGTESVNIGGWFLTDDSTIPTKYRIPDGTTIPANGYLTFTETNFNATPGTNNSFAFGARGDEVFLFSGDVQTNLTGYSHSFAFGDSPPGVSFGRHVNSIGDEDLVAQVAASFGTANPGPAIGPIVISEIQYHPEPGGDEFIEFANISTSAVLLFDAAFPSNTWRVSGLGYSFPAGVTVPAKSWLLVVATNPASFRTKYAVPPEVLILGPYTGGLQDSGERLQVQRPGMADTNGTPYYTVDLVRYNDRAPWPPAADGSGASLQRHDLAAYGNDPIHWEAATPTPGRPADPVDTDGDGLPDYWEAANATDPLVADAQADPDADGATNLEEFGAGTNPQSALSSLKLVVLAVGPALTKLQFLAVPNRDYSVLRSDSLGTPTWLTLQDVTAGSEPRLITIDDIGPVLASRFYRVVTPRLP
jgi:hypothetical protein